MEIASGPNTGQVGGFECAGQEMPGHHLCEQYCIMFMRHQGGTCAVCRRAIEREIRM